MSFTVGIIIQNFDWRSTRKLKSWLLWQTLPMWIMKFPQIISLVRRMTSWKLFQGCNSWGRLESKVWSIPRLLWSATYNYTTILFLLPCSTRHPKLDTTVLSDSSGPIWLKILSLRGRPREIRARHHALRVLVFPRFLIKKTSQVV